MKNVKMLLFAFLMSVLTVNAQDASVENVLNLRTAKHSGQIIENNKLVGYFIFYTKEKIDKDNTAYEIEMFDDNYNPSSKFEIVRPKNSYLVEMVYNGSVFMLHFYDPKTGYEFVTFDRNGDMKGSNAISKDAVSKWDLNKVLMNLQSSTENVSIYPNGTNGFIRSTFTNYKKVGYEIVAYDNEANEVWSYKSNEASEMLEMVEINDISANYLTATVTKKKNLTTREMSNYLLLLNLSDGSQITEISMGDDATGLRSVLKSFLNESKKNISIVGEYYNPNDDIVKDKSQGLYMQEISLSGEDLGITNYAWKGDIDQFASLTDGDGNDNRPFYAFFHDVVVSKNGHIFLIGEQFLKQVSAGGIAMKVAANAMGATTNASAFEMLLGDMIVVEFDAEKTLVDFKTVEKKKTKIILPAGMGIYGSTTLGYYIKSIGAFDYAFTSRNKEKDIYDVIYIDGNRREDDQSEKSDLMVGVISIKGGAVTENRIPIFCESKNWWIQPGKPGYISVSEYFRKEKKINMRLEKLTY